MSDFTHLHVHSHYSIFQGLAKPKELAARAKELNYNALALTDYGLCAGFPGFVMACKKEGIKPILGFEAYIVPDRMVKEKGERRLNVLLIAKNRTGYQNLIDISSEGHINGTYYGKPRIDLNYLASHAEGLICSTANLSGHVPTKIQLNEEDKALAAMGWYRDLFGDDFYAEIMFHEYSRKATQDLEMSVMKRLLEMAQKMDVKAFCSNDVRYCRQEEAPHFEAYMCCAPPSRPLKDQRRFSMNSNEFYLKTPEEMARYFNPELMTMTAEIVEKVESNILGGTEDYLPSFDVPEGHTEESFLRSLVYEGMKTKGIYDKPEYRERAEREMKVFEACNYVKYFLVLWDFVNAAKRNGITVGPGRGSAAGSLCLYALNITKLDPLEHGLLFERFLSVAVERKIEASDFGVEVGDGSGSSLTPERLMQICRSKPDFDRDTFLSEGKELRRLGVVEQLFDLVEAGSSSGDVNGCNSWLAYWGGLTSTKPTGPLKINEKMVATRVSPPDVDLDFDYHRRDEVYRYLDNKYGEKYTCNIGTYTTLGCKNVLKFLSKVFDLGNDWDPQNKDRHATLAIGTELADMVPGKPGIDFEEAFAHNPALKLEMLKYGEPFFNACLALEGRNMAMGQHPAGYVVSKTPIHELVPMRAKNNVTVSQFDMAEMEELGLLKYDVLALKTLTVIADTVKMVKERHGVEIDPDELDFSDQKVFQVLNDGITNGIFQYESDGMTELLRNMKVDCFDDMVAAAAIFRPGPLGAKVNETYCDVKHGRAKPVYDHPSMEGVLESTYGCLIYQEQVMELSKVMAGFTSSQADKLRKAVGKKNQTLMAEVKPKFIKGCVDNGISENIAIVVWGKIEEFGYYGFNKSHSACYAFIAYQTAYLKRYYPLEFMCALLTSVIGKPDKLPKYMREARDVFNFPLYRPDVNISGVEFEIFPEEQALQVPLTYLKGVGHTPAMVVIENRPYASFREFVEKTHGKGVNKTVVEALIDAGSFSKWDEDSEKLKTMYQGLIKEIKSRKVKKERFSGGTVPLLAYRYSETENGNE